MNTPPPDDPPESDSGDFAAKPQYDPWADDPSAPKEPGFEELKSRRAERNEPDDGDELNDDEQNTDVTEPYDIAAEYHAVERDTQDDEPGIASSLLRGPRLLLDPDEIESIEHEILYQHTVMEFVEPPPPPPSEPIGGSRSTQKLFWITLTLFAMSFALDGWRWMLCVVSVVFVHELGHYLAMRAFGYRNVRMFFVPFLGAAVSGKNDRATALQQGIMYLAGPLPGLALALVGYWTLWPVPDESSMVFQLLSISVLLNGLNLLPFLPLDGGRLFDVLFFSRRPWLTVIFRVLGVAGLIALMVVLNSILAYVVFGLMALLMLVTIPLNYHLAKSRRTLRQMFPNLAPEPADVSDAARRNLFESALPMAQPDFAPDRIAMVMRQIHGHAAAGGTSIGATIALLFAYISGWACVVAVGMMIIAQGTERNQLARDLVADYSNATIQVMKRRTTMIDQPDAVTRSYTEEPTWTALEARWAQTPSDVRTLAERFLLDAFNDNATQLPAEMQHSLERLKTLSP